MNCYPCGAFACISGAQMRTDGVGSTKYSWGDFDYYSKVFFWFYLVSVMGISVVTDKLIVEKCKSFLEQKAFYNRK